MKQILLILFVSILIKEFSFAETTNSENKYLRNKKMSDILYSQFRATQNVFLKKKIPFRSFIIKKRDEKTLGELFAFFILETILLGKALNLNPYNQPAVESIKVNTFKILKNI